MFGLSADGGVLRTEFYTVSFRLCVLFLFPNKVVGFAAKEAQPRRLRSRQRFQAIGTSAP